MPLLHDGPLTQKSFAFACRISKFSSELKKVGEYDLAKQLWRSGTSIGANAREGKRAASPKDLKHKLGISLKEADETIYWLELAQVTTEFDTKELIADCDELIRILVSLIKKLV